MPKLDKKKIASRITEIMEDKRVKSKRAFALSLDTDPSFFNKVLSAVRSVPDTMIEQLERKYFVNKEWLLLGKGEKYGPTVPRGDEKEAATPTQLLPVGNVKVTLADYIRLLEDNDRFLKENFANLNDLSTATLAHLKAMVEADAERESKGDQKKKEDLQLKMGSRIAFYAGLIPSKDIHENDGKEHKQKQ